MDTVPGFRRDASWYRRPLAINAPAGQVHRLYFEGANMETDVYVNGKRVGGHVGGYLGFTVDVSEALVPGQVNDLMVRVSNRYNPNLIPSQKADFFPFGGITRDVWLLSTPKTFISRVQIDTPKVSAKAAETSVTVETQGIGTADGARADTIDVTDKTGDTFQVMLTLMAASGDVVHTQASPVAATGPIKVSLATVASPALWSVDAPNLYTLRVDLVDPKGTIVNSHEERFGYRWFEMRAHQGFFLNGQRVLLRGTHRHEEHAGLGAALSNAQHRKDMEMIKKMGANFVRLAHYPQDPEVYRAADELGLILWDELPWCRGGKGEATWEANTERLWRAQIRQNHNHPSIAFWSAGNEIYWEADFPGGGATEKLNPYLQKLHDIAKEMDPSRMTTIRKYYPGATIVDAFSPSIWAGWYGGAYGTYEATLVDSMKKYPRFVHMEYGGSSHVGRHTETPITKDGLTDGQVSVEELMNQASVRSVAKDSDWNENYMVDLFDWHLLVSENLPNFGGNAQWAIKDFGTPLRPENPIPYINQKGLLDRNGNPKDAYYVFASYWAKEPFCYIESHTWTHRNGPKEGRDVSVYCNTDAAELFLGETSLGKRQKDPKAFPAGGLVWHVPFQPGPNVLRVKGFKDEREVAEDAMTVNYLVGEPGKLKTIKLTQSTLPNGRIRIHAEAVDADGNRVTTHDRRVYFTNMTDSGTLVENQGTPTGSSTIEMANGYAAVDFIPGATGTVVELRTQNVRGSIFPCRRRHDTGRVGPKRPHGSGPLPSAGNVS